MANAAVSALRRAVAPAFLAIWALVAAGVALRWHGALDLALLAAIPFAIATFAAAPVAPRVVIVVVLGASLALAFGYSVPAAARRGAESGLLAAAFLATLQMLRIALETSPTIHVERAELEALDDRRLHDACLARAYLLASVLAAGALAVLGPLLAPDALPERRRAFAESALQGVALAVLWSPFFVAMAVCTRLVPGPSLASVMASGLAMALAGIVMSHLAFGRRGGPYPFASLKRTAAQAVLFAGGIVVANQLFGLGNLEAIVLGVPLVAVALARRELQAGPRPLMRRWAISLEAICVESLIVLAALMLGEVIGALIAGGIITLPSGIASAPPYALVAVPSFVMVSLAVIGLHPIVSGSALLPLLASLGSLHGLVVIGSVLVGWMLCVVLSVFVVPVMFAAAVFRTRSRDLVLGRNLVFSGGFLAIGIGYLCLLQAVLG